MIYVLEKRLESEKWSIVAVPRTGQDNNELAMRSAAMQMAANDAKPSAITRKPSSRTARQILLEDYRLGLYIRKDVLMFTDEQRATSAPAPEPVKRNAKKGAPDAPATST